MDLARGPRLTPAPAVAALLVTEDGRYLLQHRDDLDHIFFPGFWGAFGGAIDGEETPEQTIRRELAEELAFMPPRVTYFATTWLDFSFAGHGTMPRHFFEVPIREAEVPEMVLGEGQGLALLPGADIVGMSGVVPYDATAIWQHMTRLRYQADDKASR